jgi:hypothetical protein
VIDLENKANYGLDVQQRSSMKIAGKFYSPNALTTDAGACPAAAWNQASLRLKRVKEKYGRKLA